MPAIVIGMGPAVKRGEKPRRGLEEALAARGERERSEYSDEAEAAAETLWPDISPAKALAALETLLDEFRGGEMSDEE